MKESVTTFDLEAAFKALDDIEVPKVSGGVAPNRLDLQENLKRRSKFDVLMEEYYDVNDTQDLEEAHETREGEIAQAKLARIEKIVDLDAESSEDLLTSYVGKFIVQCPQCMTLFYKNPEDIEGSEDAEVVNVSEVCQHCGNDTGYSIIGKVGEVEPDEVEEPVEEPAEEEVPVEEGEEEIPVEEEPAEEEDFDLDLDVDDLDVEESVETPAGTPLVESVETETMTEDFEEVSDAEFEELITDPEFKKPVEEADVSGMVQQLDGEELEEGIFDFLKGDNGKADYVLKNARKDYRVLGHTSDDAEGIPADDEKNKLYKRYLVIAYDSKYADKSAIDTAPESDDNLVEKKKLPFGEYKKAADYAKSWSSQSKNGPATIYFEKPNGETVFVTRFFKGAKSASQIDNLFKEVQDAINKAKQAPRDERRQKNADDKAKQAEERAEDKIQVTPEEFGEKIGKKYKATIKFPEPVDPIVKEFESNEFAKAAKTAEVFSKSSSEPAVVTFEDGDADNADDIIVAYSKGKCSVNNMKKIYIKLTQTEEADSREFEPEEVEESLETPALASIMETLSDIHEESLEECIANALTKVYANVDSFKLDKCNYLNEAFEVEGTIKFKSGKTRATKYTFTEAVQDLNRVQFIGSNQKLAADGTFKINGHIESGINCLYTESFEYNYSIGKTLVEGLATK